MENCQSAKLYAEVEFFRYDGDLMNSNGEYYVPDWAAKTYEDDVLYYDCFIPDYAPDELFIDYGDYRENVRVGDYVVKMPDGSIHILIHSLFDAMTCKEEKITLEAINYNLVSSHCQCPNCGTYLLHGNIEEVQYCKKCGTRLHMRTYTANEINRADTTVTRPLSSF